MNKKTTGLVAGAAGAALLVGGATFALWSDSSSVAGGTLTSGNLDVGDVSQTWVDESENTIDFEDFRIVPGDTIYGAVSVPVALEGDHMLAELSVDGLRMPSGELVPGLHAANLKVEIDGKPFAITGAHPIRFASEDNVNPGDLPVLTDESTIEVSAEVTFDRDTKDRDLTEASAAVEGFSVSLQQVRND